jgi:hypothetical protein
MSNKQNTNSNTQSKQVAVKDTKKHDESYEEYTDKELAYLDKYQAFSHNQFDDEELYEIITKHDFDDSSIQRELREYMKLVDKKGEEYGWQAVVKGKSKVLLILESKPDEHKQEEVQPKEHEAYYRPRRQQYEGSQQGYNTGYNTGYNAGYSSNYRGNRGNYQGYRGARGTRGFRGGRGMRGGRPQKYYRDEAEFQEVGYKVIEMDLDDLQNVQKEQVREDSPEEDFLLSDTNKEIPSPKKEHVQHTKHIPEQKEHVKEQHVSYRVHEEHTSHSNQPSQPIFNKGEKHLKDLIDEPSKRKFDDIEHVQSTSFHISTKQPEKKENSTTNSGSFTIGTNTTPKYIQTNTTNTIKPTITNTNTKVPKKEEPLQNIPQQNIPQQNIPQQAPFYPFPYPMFFYPPNYDPTQVPQTTGVNPNMPIPHPMMYYMPPYMQQPEKVDNKPNFGNFNNPTVNILLTSRKTKCLIHILPLTTIIPR